MKTGKRTGFVGDNKKMKWNTFALIKGKIWSDVMNNRAIWRHVYFHLFSFDLFAFEFRYLSVFGVQW